MIRKLLIIHWVIAVVFAEVLTYALFIFLVSDPPGAFAGGLVLIGTLLSLLAWPVSLQITQPLERLEASANEIAGGNLSSRVEITGEHMIGRQLGNAFNIMAEKVERMIRGGKELTANISHELRSPLTRIRIAGECLNDALDRGDSKDAKEMLQAMWDDIDEADRMIGRILEFSKIDLHEPHPVTEEVLLAEIVQGLVKTLAPMARMNQLDIKLELDSSVRVMGDTEWLRVMLKNVVENALKYTCDGGFVMLSVRNDSGMAIVEVTNTSEPLESEELELIFKPFYRGRVSNGEGTGLGLSIVRKIVELHQGEVGAKNVREGFQVWVRLPVA